MTDKQFFDYLLEAYIDKTGNDIPAGELGYYLEAFLSSGEDIDRQQPLTKREAARMIHEFMKNVMKLPDKDWGSAASIKDIYECRVCANAIAQVCVRGIMQVREDGSFGHEDLLTDAECTTLVDACLISADKGE